MSFMKAGDDADDVDDDGDVGEDGNMVVGTGDNLWYSLSWQSLLSRSGGRRSCGRVSQCHKTKTINMTFTLRRPKNYRMIF